MRPVSSRVVTLWITVLCLVAALCSLDGVAAAQAAGAKRKLSKQAPVAGSLSLARGATPNAPPGTTDTWTGGGGANTGWSDASNWNNGAITTGENILINLTTAATDVDSTFTIGTLTLSKAGDSATIENGQDLIVDGNISNAGTITLGSTTTYTYLQIGANLTLSGAGTLVLGSGNIYNVIQATATGNTLTNLSTIEGMGTIGNDTGLIVNNTTGTINANVSGQNLTLNSTDTSTNTGTLEASGGGTLVLNGQYGGNWTNTSGNITAATGSAVVLENGVTVTGGTLSTSGSGFVYGDGANLVGVTNTGQFEVQNGNFTNVSGTITNTGTITLDSTTTYTYLQLNGNTTLTGSGTLVLGSANIYNLIQAANPGSILTNQSTIEGEGQIGNGTALVVNNTTGTINANVSGGTLTLNSASASTNTGTLEATGSGTLVLNGQNGENWTNTGGNITAGAGSAVVLENGVTVTGGTLNGSGTGIVYGDGATLVGLTTEGNFQVQNGYVTNIQGTINNTGTITLASTTTTTELDVTSSGATLSGGGTVVMGAGAQYSYIDGPSGASFTNSNNTIEGTGVIGNGDLTLVNNGTINANVSPTVLNSPLQLNSGSGGITNTNILEATNGGELYILNSTLTNTGSGAVIEALGADGSGNASNVQLSGDTINGGTLTTSGAGVIYGYGSTTLVGVTNAGNFQVPNGGVTYLSGTITNTGTMTLDSTTTYTYLDLGANTTLTGGGTVVMGAGNIYSTIGGPSNFTLTNSNNTIEGDGFLGNTQITLVNNATIDANVSGQTLTLQPVAGTNTGTMEATNGGTLLLYASPWTNTGGTITAATGSAVDLDDITLTGGTLTTSGAGVISAYGSTTLVGLTNAGNLSVPNGNVAYLSGTITNTGTMTLSSTTTYTYLDTGANTTLTGGGTIVMGAGNIYATLGGISGTTLTNSNNTIEGVGFIGNTQITFVNNGTVDANVSGQTLQLQPVAGTNTATMEATGGGQLQLYSSSWNNTGGTITAAADSDVLLSNGVTVTGGTLNGSGTGIVYGDGATLVGLTTAGNFQIQNGNTTNIQGTINNTGTITVASTSGDTFLDVTASGATLSGGGTVVMGAGAQYSYIDGPGGASFTNSNNTIEGTGFIGNGDLTLVNNGTINANVSPTVLNAPLTLQSGSGGITNTGTLEATNGGELYIVSSTLTNSGSGAVIEALGADGSGNASNVQLNGDTINGGTLKTTGVGVIYGYGSTTLAGVTNAGSFWVPNGGVTYLSGTITNTGTITLGSTTTYTYLDTAANTTLTGGGTVVMGAGNIYATLGGVSGTTLTNSNNTIEGDGFLGNGQITFVNNGTVNANVSGQTLLIEPAGAIADVNTKTMEATNGGQLELYSGSFTNTGGTITAATSSDVYLNVATVTGGTLSTSGTGATAGIIYLNNSSTLVGLTTTGNVQVQNGQVGYLSGTIDNTGTITVDSTTTYTDLNLAANTTLTGKGTVVMGAGNIYSRIDGASGLTLTNSGNTIEGDGFLGNGDLVVTNSSGSMIANVSGQTLQIQSSGVGTTNDGTFEAESGGILNVVGTLTNYTSGTNTLTAGTYIANGSGSNVYLPLGSSGGITTLSASVTEENGGLVLNGNNSNNNALNGLTSITSTGALTIGGVAFTDAGSFSNAGSLTLLAGESFNVGSLTQISSGKLTAGTYVLDANLNLTGTAQTITTNAATLTLAGGTIENTSNSTNALAGLASNTGKLTIAGTGNSVSTTATSFSNAGTLTINSGDSFTAHALTQLTGSNSSKTLSAGTYVLAGNLDLTTTGISITTNSANLTLEGGTIKSGSANALAALANNTGSLTIAGASKSVTTSAASFSNTGTLTIDKTDSFTAGNLTQISSGTLSSGTYVLAGNLDLTTAGISVTTNSANLTLEGGTINSNNVNALSALAFNTGSLTIAGTSTAISTTAASFSNTGTLTIDKGDTFTAPALTQVSGSTLSGGTFVLAGNLDLTTSGISITTNSANLTLEGGTINSNNVNALSALASNTDSLTLASNASFTAVGGFSNSGALTIDKGSTFTLTGSNVLTNLSAGTLGSGTYTIGGTLQLTSANGGITTNAANLTLTGTAAKINDGTSNALSGFDNNTGTFALASGATLTTASSNFSNSGTVTVAKGTTLTVGGTSHSYNQTAGTTTVDGTLSGGTTGAASFTGGSIFGAGTLKANTSVGNASGAAVTINVGDSGKAGLLAITGTYTQLATGTMNVSIGGLTTGTYSELTVSGTTSLGGTLSVAIVNGLVLTAANIGTQFTILSSTGTLTGTFSNPGGTVTVGTDEFSISYVGNTVVLTLTSVTAPTGSKSSAPAAQDVLASSKPAGTKPVAAASKSPVLTSGLRHRVSGVDKTSKPILVVGLTPGRVGGGSELNDLRRWEHIPTVSMSPVRLPVAVAALPSVANVNSSRVELPTTDPWVGQNHAIGAQSPLAGWTGTSTNRRTPVKVMPPMLPRITR